MTKWVIYQTHWLLGITAGLILSLMGMTGAIMSFEDEIMTALSHGIVDVPVRSAPLMTPDALLARFVAQKPDSIPIKITLFPHNGHSARVVYLPRSEADHPTDEDNTNETYLNPYTGQVLGKAVGEAFFDAVRELHRYLLLPHNRGGAGRPITTVAAFCLLFFALSGLYLRWPRRVLDWRAWLKPDLRRRGRNLYWSLHSVAGTWVCLIFLVFAISGPTFAYDSYRDELTALLTWTARVPGQSAPAPHKTGSPAPLDEVWAGFQAMVHTEVTTVLFPVSDEPTRTVTVRYLTSDSPHYRAYNEITIDRTTGGVTKHNLYARQTLGKRLSIGMLSVHRGKVFGIAGQTIFMLAALLLPLFCLTGYLLYLDRRRKQSGTRQLQKTLPSQGDTTSGEVLIAFASQSGTAEQIAWASANELLRGGRAARVAPLSTLDIPKIKEAGTLLVVASTFGTGEPPDAARLFAREVLSATANLSGVRSGVLALGHRDYPDFCGFGRSVDSWLRTNGVDSLFPLIEMDADDGTALDSWRQELRALGATASAGSWQTEPTRPWTLIQRTLVNPGSDSAEAYHLELEAEDPNPVSWTPGDIAVITPRRSRPETGTEAADASLPTREYSISSIAPRGRLELLVRRTTLADGQPGLGSGWLTQHTELGDTIHLRIRSNPNFHPPATGGPMILIGSGTGLAGLRAHLLHRQHHEMRGAWLIFGERSPRTDRFHSTDIESWLRDGTLTRCDLVFSRDPARREYVQHRIEECAAQVDEWVEKDGAAIYICGGIKMGVDAHAVLQKILSESRLDELAAAGRYRRDVY